MYPVHWRKCGNEEMCCDNKKKIVIKKYFALHTLKIENSRKKYHPSQMGGVQRIVGKYYGKFFEKNINVIWKSYLLCILKNVGTCLWTIRKSGEKKVCLTTHLFSRYRLTWVTRPTVTWNNRMKKGVKHSFFNVFWIFW